MRKFTSRACKSLTYLSTASRPATAVSFVHPRETPNLVRLAGGSKVRSFHEATIPKLDPAPLIAQKRSALDVLEASTTLPSAKTTVAPWTKSKARPWVWELKPKPPCRKWPETPTLHEVRRLRLLESHTQGHIPGAGAVCNRTSMLLVEEGCQVA